MTARPDLQPILDALRLARTEAEKAYQDTPADSWRDRAALAGVVDDLRGPIAAMRELVHGKGGAA